MTSSPKRAFLKRHVAVTVLLAAATAGIWAAWLGWDTERDIDAAGVSSGPFQVWQIAGVVVCLLAVVFLAVRWTHPLPVVVTVTAVFTVAWSLSAARDQGEDSGANLWPIGALLLVVGMLIGASLVAWVAKLFWSRRNDARQASDALPR